MGTRILIGSEQGDAGVREHAVLFDSVTGWAFGPVFSEDEALGTSPEDMAELFLEWLKEHGHEDPRIIPPGILESLYGDWWKGRQEATMDERMRAAPDFDPGDTE